MVRLPSRRPRGACAAGAADSAGEILQAGGPWVLEPVPASHQANGQESHGKGQGAGNHQATIQADPVGIDGGKFPQVCPAAHLAGLK
jgi:hypothetical protein